MKKILIVMLSIAVVLGSVSCDNSGSDGLSSGDVLSLAQKFYKAAADAINGGSSDGGTAWVDSMKYRVSYLYDDAAGDGWTLDITAYEGASETPLMEFTVASDESALVTVTAGTGEYSISAKDIMNNVMIGGGSPSDDPEEQDKPEMDDDEEEAQPALGEEGGSSESAPVL